MVFYRWLTSPHRLHLDLDACFGKQEEGRLPCRMLRMSKAVLAIALVLVLLVQVGLVIAECNFNSKSISATACYRYYSDEETRPYASVRCSCKSDTSDHDVAVMVDMLLNGRFLSRGSGTGSASYSTWMSNGTGTITAVGCFRCTACGHTAPSITASDAVWENQ